MAISIAPATTPEDVAAIAALFHEYTAGLGIDLAFQSFADELKGLPGKYAAPHGVMLLARGDDGGLLGCVAVRPLPSSVDGPEASPGRHRCELKRLYVRSAARGTGLGEALARRALAEAVARGYTEMVMDTLAAMGAARRLYDRLGFAETEAYYTTPLRDQTIFYRKALEAAA